MDRISAVFERMVAHEAGVPQRIQHFVKVHGFAMHIGRMEGLDAETLRTLEIAALVHDIGIKPALERHGSAAGPLQEREGAPLAEAMLRDLGASEAVIKRVCYLVAHHHTYSDIQGLDYQILIEADFLVNFFEAEMGTEAIRSTLNKIFVTETGKRICREMFLRNA